MELMIQLNGGFKRGASANFARLLGVNPAAVSRWLSRKQCPDEKLRDKIAEVLKIKRNEVDALFPPNVKRDPIAEIDELRESVQELTSLVREMSGEYRAGRGALRARSRRSDKALR